MGEKLVYLCIPYTWNPDESFKIANKVAAKLMEKGFVVFSPISHSHPIADEMDEDLKVSHGFWMTQDLPLLRKADIMYVVVIGDEGEELLKNSRGCQEELKLAKHLGIDVIKYYYE